MRARKKVDSAKQKPLVEKSKGGARKKLREFFLTNIGVTLNSEQLREVSGNISEWARRIRELRDEEGYKILSHNDRSELKPGEYLLETPKPEPAFSRDISKETRAFVLDRNGFTCQMCGAVAGEPHPYDTSRKTRLHLGHIIDKSQGGTDDASNLRAICSVCNEGASNTTLTRPDLLKLMTQIRRAKSPDQVEALKWLIGKYTKQAKIFLD
jgi:HNH endonuclease